MRHCRAPSHILWTNDGWKQVTAETPKDALNVFRQLGINIGLPSIQSLVGTGWQFASEVPEYLGGYNQRNAERL